MKPFLRALLPAVALVVAGCGSSTAPPPALLPGTPPVLTPASSFESHPFVLSPDDHLPINSMAKSPLTKSPKLQRSAAAGAPGASVIDHWFYLVNGVGIPVLDTTPFTPNVLTVDGPAPQGAPEPNGGDIVNDLAMSPTTYGSQLWKAVASPTAGNVFLRSSTSVITSSVATHPSLLFGYGETVADLDLGVVPTYNYGNPAIFWNQSLSPTGDQSSFQQWSYDSNARLTNASDGEVLYGNGSTVGVATGAVAASNQWYAYPNYFMEQVVSQPNSSPPFPAFEGAGQEAAYQYQSAQFLNGVKTGCNYEGAEYDGIRCEYDNLNASASLSLCATNAGSWSNGTPPVTKYGKVPISTADFEAVATQLHLECYYAENVQNVFATYGQIMDFVFASSGTAINQLATDVGISSSQSLNPVPTQVIEGILYTMLSATGDPAVGALANVMETAVNSAVAGNSASTIQFPLATTVDALYTDLEKQMKLVADQASSNETAILEDWGRLQLIGPLATNTGYNGLAMLPAEKTNIQNLALQGYELNVMQQLMPPSGYQLGSYVATTSEPSNLSTVPSYAQYSWETFGSSTGSSNVAYVFGSGGYPDATVMTTDIQGNGASMFDFFNGLNGWNTMPQSPFWTENLGCSSQVSTLFNATSTDLSVTATPKEGNVATPGRLFAPGGIGTDAVGTFELRPYGYLPIYTATGDNESGVTLDVDIYDPASSSTSAVATFSLSAPNQDGGCGLGPLTVSRITTQDGYSFVPSTFNLKTNTGASEPQGMWVTIVN